MDDKVSSSSEKFRVTTKTLYKKKDTLVLVFRLISFPSEHALRGGLSCDKEMKDTRRKRRREKKPNNFNERERERERANDSLSAFTHFFS